MIENNSSFKIHNKFELKLYDQDGNLKQEAFGYNEANSEKYIYCGIFGGYDFEKICLGKGDPTTFIPSKNDLSLNSPLFAQNINFIRLSPFIKEYKTIEFQGTTTFPATKDYIGKITEIGIGYSLNELFSHAYIVDAEGNAIYIDKTEYDILKITATIYITPLLATVDSQLNFKFFPAYASSLGGGYIWSHNYKNSLDLMNKIFPTAKGGTKYYFSPDYVPDSDDGQVYNNAMCIYDNLNVNTTNTATNKPTLTNKLQNYDVTFPITYTAINQLYTQTQNNFGFAHSIVFPLLGAIELPCPSIIPEYVIKDIPIGVGNGQTTHFFTSINELALDENQQPKLVVYIQNSETSEKLIVDSSEYQFINFNIKQSPLWNKILYIENAQNYQIYPSDLIKLTDSYGQKGFEFCWAALTNSTFSMNNFGGPHLVFAPSAYWREVFYDEQGITLDHAKIGSIKIKTPYDSIKSPSMILSYRNNDTEEWTSISIPSSNMSKFEVTTFDPITAKYWQIQTSNFGGSLSNSYSYTLQGSNRLGNLTNADVYNQNVYGYDPNYIVVGNSAEYDFSKVGLNFKTPPPEGAIITMDATLDLPYKTPDGSMTFSYQATLNAPTSS